MNLGVGKEQPGYEVIKMDGVSLKVGMLSENSNTATKFLDQEMYRILCFSILLKFVLSSLC